MDIKKLTQEVLLKNMTPEQQLAVLDSVQASVKEAKAVQKQKIAENVDLVLQALKRIEADMLKRVDSSAEIVEARVKTIKDGKDGKNGLDGKAGKDGINGKDGKDGRDGRDGFNGKAGERGQDGVGVQDAHIDFDGCLIIKLTDGQELNVGEVVPFDVAEKIKVIGNGGGTSQYVVDALADLQTQIDNISGGLTYKGTWNASTNSPTLTSSTGTKGWYYVVSTAGSTNLDGVTDWQIGDWAIYNGSTWQKIDQTDVVTSVNGSTGAVVLTASSIGALDTITSTDGSVTVSGTGATRDLSVATAASTTNVLVVVRNTTGATLTKGTVVYMSGATGQIPTVTKAIATTDGSSAQTLGMITADLANNSNGHVTIIGLISDIDTSAYTDGAQLYLSGSTAGSVTTTKPYAPTHLVYVGIVEYAHAIHGKIFVKVQNGYELDELHNVSAQSPTTGQTIVYNSSTSLWEKNTVSLTAGVNGTLPIANGGTGATSAAGALTALGAYAASNPSGYTTNTGTVTSITAGTGLSGGTISTSGTIDLASGYGDTLNPYASKTANYVLAAPNGSSGVPTFRALVAADIPTLNQNTTGSAATVTTTINSGVVATTQTAGDNSTKVATTAYVNAITGTSGINGFKNRIINGAMMIDQRGSASSPVASNVGTYAVDRMKFFGTGGGVFTSQQSTVAPSGFTNSNLFTVTTADASIAAGDLYWCAQVVEGYNVADLGWGAAGASTVTLSFWVRSSVTGTYSGSLNNGAYDRSYLFTYTINSSNTWEQKSITVTGDTSGTWLKTNGIGLYVILDLGSGSTYSNATTNTWLTGGYQHVTGSTNWISTNGATFYITGVQLEKGSTATSFDYRPYGAELALCQRYYQTSTNAQAIANGSTSMIFTIGMQVTPRAAPTVGLTGVYSVSDIYTADQTQSSATVGTLYGYSSNALLVATSSWSGLTSGRLYFSRYNNANVFTLSSEL